MLSVLSNSRWLLAIFITLLSSMALSHGMSDEEKHIIIEGGNLHYIWVGATHMLSGYDHLAFVFGIIFFLTKFRDIVKYITAFTVGHSITLIIATFNAVQVNYFLIDAVIALSVCYIAFQNLDGFKKYLNIKAPNMLAMIFGLGLIHGLGLSTRLQQLPLDADHLLMNIISFNIGIELGQISALAIMLVLIAAFRKNSAFPVFSKISNTLLVMAGIYLFFMQMHGYEHSAHADEFEINKPIIQEAEVGVSQSLDEWQDTIQITVPARSDIEYKLQLARGASFNYLWETEKGEVFYDFHGEPNEDQTGYFETFEKSTSDQAMGALTSTFAGTHGWYWKNNHNYPVVIYLKIKGDYQRLDQAPTELKKSDQPKTQHDSID